MQKVITINLNGRAFQLDEEGYDALRAYLDRSRQALAHNPDLTEIMADLEQAIGEKCQKVLGLNKTVVEVAEVKQILADMGPVDGGSSEEPSPAAAGGAETGSPHSPASPRRLYQIREGAWISGVCTGIAAYFDIDVMVVRIIFVVLALATKGTVGVVAYLFLMFVLPHANTSEEHAAAHGAPFNAKEIVDQVTSTARHAVDQAFAAGGPVDAATKHAHRAWKNDWRRGKEARRAWKREWRRSRREWRASRWRHSNWWAPPAQQPSATPMGYGSHITAGVMVPVLALISAAVFWVWLASMLSLLSTGALFGRSLPEGLPLWAGLLFGILLYNAVAWPLHAARRAAYHTLGGTSFMSVGAWDGMMSLGFSVLAFWLAYQYIPEVHNFLNNLPAVEDNIREIFRSVPTNR